MPRHLSAEDHGRSVPLSPRMLHVIVVISNPVRWESRIRLAKQFLAHMRQANVHITLVEHAFGIRPLELDHEEVDTYVPLRGGDDSELWLKESLINIGVRHLPKDWRYMAWIDADLTFVSSNWALDTLHALQHWPVVQNWSRCMDLNQRHEVIPDESGNFQNTSFGSAWVAGKFDNYDILHPGNPQGFAAYISSHVGYSWAIRREAYEGIGGLINWVPTGAADWLQACGFTGRLTPHPGRTEAFNKRLMIFQDRCDRHIQQSVGYVDGTIMHHFHGGKARRAYVNRDVMLQKSGFDPDVDLIIDANGIPVLSGENRKLRDWLRRYFRSRDEDARGLEDGSPMDFSSL